MEDMNLIKGFGVDLDYSKLGYSISALILLQVKGKHLKEVESRLAKFGHVCFVYDITGDFDVALLSKFHSAGEMDHFIKEVLAMDYVERAVTSIVLNNVKEDYRMSL
jgi:Lrp/AsnC family transcriptional regulator, regulator for asnA, asnC and gidA